MWLRAKKSLRTCNDRANGNELDDMNSREPVWSEPGKFPHRLQNGISPLRKTGIHCRIDFRRATTATARHSMPFRYAVSKFDKTINPDL
jgi:hypothetical protein